MKKITITLYSFNELPSEVQEKVIEDNRNINLDHNWYDFIYDNWKEKLTAFGFINPEIYFSGFYSQGDGACFDADIDLETVLKNAPEEYKKLILANNYIEFIISSYGMSNIYSHEQTKKIDFSITKDHKLIKINTGFSTILEKFLNWLESKRIEFCQQIYKDLQESYEYLTSDEAVKNTIIANEYTFEINGSMRNE